MLRILLLGSVLLLAPVLQAAPPTEIDQLKLYTHCRGWLINFPASYIATNIRGAHDREYVMRRTAALDLLREKRDFGTVYDLMVELERGSFLDGAIIDLLVEWKAKRAIPLLIKISADKKRKKAIRTQADTAVKALLAARTDAPPKY